jgi:hypothetical protein
LVGGGKLSLLFDFDAAEERLGTNFATPAFGAPLDTEGGMGIAGRSIFDLGLVDDSFFDFLTFTLDVLAAAEVDVFTASFSLFSALFADLDAL